MKPKLKVLLSNLLLLAGGLLVVELVFGNWLRPRNRIARLNLLSDRKLVFDATPLYGAEGKNVLYQRDRFGLRGAYPDPSRIDILTIGGSTTDQRYITEGRTWQDVLAAEFRKTGKTVNVVNAGIDGQSTYGSIKDFDWWFSSVPGLRVKYFLFYIGINDFYRVEGSPSDSLEPGPGFRSLLSENSALYHVLRTIRGIYKAKRYGIGHRGVDFSKLQWTMVPRRSDYPEIMREHLIAYQQRLKALLERSRRFGGKAICVTQSTRNFKVVDGTVFGRADTMRYGDYEIDGVDFYYMLGMLNRRTLGVCREAGAVAVDAAGGIQWEDADFYNFAHNTPRGAEKLGRYLYENLRYLF